MLKKVLTAIFISSMAAGFVLLLGTAGSCDLNVIDFKTSLIQDGIGLALAFVGYIGLKFVNPIFFI